MDGDASLLRMFAALGKMIRTMTMLRDLCIAVRDFGQRQDLAPAARAAACRFAEAPLRLLSAAAVIGRVVTNEHLLDSGRGFIQPEENEGQVLVRAMRLCAASLYRSMFKGKNEAEEAGSLNISDVLGVVDVLLPGADASASGPGGAVTVAFAKSKLQESHFQFHLIRDLFLNHALDSPGIDEDSTDALHPVPDGMPVVPRACFDISVLVSHDHGKSVSVSRRSEVRNAVRIARCLWSLFQRRGAFSTCRIYDR